MNSNRRRRIPQLDSTPRERALDVLARMRRERISLRAASDEARTDPRTVRRHAGQALKKPGSRWVPRAFDRIPREMTILTPTGPEAVVVRDSRNASLLAEHANAVRAYIETGDEEPLSRLPRTEVRIRGQPRRLETDPARLDRLAQGGELHYELYRH